MSTHFYMDIFLMFESYVFVGFFFLNSCACAQMDISLGSVCEHVYCLYMSLWSEGEGQTTGHQTGL